MKTLLVVSPFDNVHFPHLGISYLLGYLRSFGLKANVFDLNIDLYNKVEEKHKHWWTSPIPFQLIVDPLNTFSFVSEEILKEYVEKILSTNSEIIGFHVSSVTEWFVKKIAKKIKSIDENKIIIFGGPEVHRVYDENKKLSIGSSKLNDFADIFVIGEGEETLLDIVRQIERCGQVRDCSGVIIKKGGELIDFGDRKLIEDMNKMPYPDFSDFDLSKYKRVGELPIAGSRGCFSRCEFCYDRLFWKKYRYRSAENIFEEMVRDKKIYNSKYFWFVDSNFNGNLTELEKLCDLIIGNNLDISWNVYGGRADVRMGESLFKKIKESGCTYLVFGIESGSQRVLDLMKKDLRIEDAAKIIRRTHDAGIRACCNFIIGFPGETDKDLEKTLNFIKDNQKFISLLHMTVYKDQVFAKDDKISYIEKKLSDSNFSKIRKIGFFYLFKSNSLEETTFWE